MAPLRTLIEEHGRIRSMLSTFETELGRFERAVRPDYEILEGSIAYCQEFLDRWHHPREDALLELLQRRDPAKAEACAELDDQHAALARTTGELVKIFEAVERDAQFSRQALGDRGRELVRAYHTHIDWEEENFFPALENALLPEDWQDVTTRFADAADPLKSNPVDRRYQALFNAIADT